ncbi:hypothetical protein MMC13_004545 [Lambiella insularis]|nr:hypothetical protein [Lambiella insularis]
MALPSPPVPLNGQCTVIYNNTLYAYQSNAFQSLPLTEGAQWSQLPNGAGVSGARCVQATYNGQDALFIVGGTTSNSSLASYPGFQRYMYAQQEWQNCHPQISVTQNRQMHGAVYLSATASILVYAGFQDDSYKESSQTFTISTNDSWVTYSYPSAAPPVINPILLPWNQSHAVLVGGDPDNNEVWTFSEASGWQQANITLPSALPDSSHVQGTVLDGSDGRKILQLFNMSASPNEVSAYLLQPASTISLVSRDKRDTESYLRRRKFPTTLEIRRRQDMLPSNYPLYNDTLAPTTTRTDFSLAQGGLGLIIISGGTSKPSDDVLAVFNETGNTWVNASQFFASGTSTSSPTPATNSALPTLSTTPSVSAASDANDGRNQSLLILGAVLGSVFGFAALCIIALLILRYLRQRRSRDHIRQTSKFPLDSKDQMDFADRGDQYVAPTRGIFRDSSHNATMPAQFSTSAVAVGSDQQAKRGLFHKAGDSGGSSKSLFGRRTSPEISVPHPNFALTAATPEPGFSEALSPEPRTAPRTDEGWSTYFMNNNNATDLTRLPPGYTRYETQSRPDTVTTASQSDYTTSRVPSSQPHSSAEVAPLNIRASHFPPSEHAWETAQHLHPIHSNSLSRQPYSPSSAQFSHIAEENDDFLDGSSGQDSWTPVATSDKGSTFGRATSSVYDSAIYPHPGDRVRIPDFPGVPTSNRTSQTTVVPLHDQRGLRSMASKDFAGGLPRPEAGPGEAPQDSRLLPREAGDASGAHRDMRRDEDMSWLNLSVR